MIVKTRISAVIRWPTASHQPASTSHTDADNAKRSGADILTAGIDGAIAKQYPHHREHVGRAGACRGGSATGVGLLLPESVDDYVSA